MDRKTVEEALRKNVHPSSQYALRDDISAELAKGNVVAIADSCPSCGKQMIVCCYVDASWGDPNNYYDNFAYICLNEHCAYGAHNESRVMTGQEREDDGTCPLCRRNVFKDGS